MWKSSRSGDGCSGSAGSTGARSCKHCRAIFFSSVVLVPPPPSARADTQWHASICAAAGRAVRRWGTAYPRRVCSGQRAAHRQRGHSHGGGDGGGQTCASEAFKHAGSQEARDDAQDLVACEGELGRRLGVGSFAESADHGVQKPLKSGKEAASSHVGEPARDVRAPGGGQCEVKVRVPDVLQHDAEHLRCGGRTMRGGVGQRRGQAAGARRGASAPCTRPMLQQGPAPGPGGQFPRTRATTGANPASRSPRERPRISRGPRAPVRTGT